MIDKGVDTDNVIGVIQVRAHYNAMNVESNIVVKM